MSFLMVKNLTHCYSNSTVETFTNISFTMAEGEIVALLGPSGGGKTTLARCIAGFEKTCGGSIYLKQKCIEGNGIVCSAEDRNIGMVFQDYSLFPHLTVEENVAFGLPRKERKNSKRVEELLHWSGLTSKKMSYPHELSGGQQQRVALIRAMAPNPQLILMDEPFSNLDPSLRHQMAIDLRSLLKKNQQSALLITHDLHEAFTVSDRMGVLKNGKLLQFGSPSDLYHRPVSHEIAAYFGEGTLIPVQHNDNMLQWYHEKWYIGDNKKMPECRSLWIRPTHVQIDISGTLKGTVLDIQFRGTYFLITIQEDKTGQVFLAMDIKDNHVSLGQMVGFTIDWSACPAFPEAP